MNILLTAIKHWKVSLWVLLALLIFGYVLYLNCDRVIQEDIVIDTTITDIAVREDPIKVYDDNELVEDPVFDYDYIIIDTMIHGMHFTGKIDLQNLTADFIFPSSQVNVSKTKTIEKTNWTAIGIGTGVGCLIGGALTGYIMEKIFTIAD
jgi:hypothetical protein